MKTDGVTDKFGEFDNNSNWALTYFYNLAADNGRFSVGAKFLDSSFNGSVDYMNGGKTDNGIGSNLVNMEESKAYSLFLMGNVRLFTLANNTISLNLGIGGAEHKTLVTHHAYDTGEPFEDNINSRHTSLGSTFAFVAGLQEMYQLTSNIAIGLEANYTNLGTAKNDYIKDADIKFKSDNMINVNGVIKFTL